MKRVRVTKDKEKKAVLINNKPIYLSTFTQDEIQALALHGLRQYLADYLLGVKTEDLFEALKNALNELSK